jgi:glycosyltransferase involved in cell wall biosynthesis
MNKKMQPKCVGLFPYGDVGNPYQLLIRRALAARGIASVAIAKSNFFPLLKATRQPIDVLQMYWPHSLFTGATPFNAFVKRTLFALDIANLRRKKFVFSAENLYPHDSPQVQRDIACTQKILNHCDGVIFTSESARQIYQSVYRLPAGAQQAVVPHIHYMDVYPNQVTREEARQRLGIADARRVILFLGRIHPYKGLHHLVEAFLEASGPDDCLVIAGRAKSEALVHQLQERIAGHPRKGAGEVKVFARFIPDEELQHFYNAADAVAVPYDDMPINPGSIVMAMGFGKCIIAPSKGPIRELVHPDALFGYAEEGKEALPGAIAAFLREHDPAGKGRRNRQRAAERHSPEVAGQRLVDLYNRIL